MRFVWVLGLVAVIGLTACGEATDSFVDSPDTTVSLSPGSAMGPGISIADALDNDSGEPLLVNGFLFVSEDGTVTLASLMAESLPPIPGGDQLTVDGLNLDDYRLSEDQGRKWTDELVQVLGVRDGDTLKVSDTFSG